MSASSNRFLRDRIAKRKELEDSELGKEEDGDTAVPSSCSTVRTDELSTLADEECAGECVTSSVFLRDTNNGPPV